MFKKKREEMPSAGADNAMADRRARDEALFESLNRSRKAKKRKVIRTAVTLILLLAVGLLVGVTVLRRQVREQFGGSGEDILSEQATRGSISTVVSGSGVLVNVDTETVSLPEGVEITEILVEYEAVVEAGDLLAVADMATVRTALADIQAEIKELDDQITAARGDTVGSYVAAGVPGRVKILHAQEGMLVEDVMVDQGSLAVISLDGYMAVQIETEALQEGDAVPVIRPDGTEIGGSVASVVGKTATILVTDNGPEFGETVTVKALDGRALGSGQLYIHNPLKVTGYAGTVKTVNAAQNQQVYASTTLFTLTDTTTHASYDALLRSRSEKEEVLLELLQIQRHGGPVSPISGSVYSVAELPEEDSETTAAITDLVVLSPDVSMSVTIDVDEADILSLALGQTAEVTVSSVSEDPLSGTVTEIDKTDATGAYTAVITLDKVDGMIPGMTASVDIRIEGVDDAILIPAEALHRTRTGYYVYTAYDEETQEYGGRVDVIPGLSNSNSVEIKSGLKEGDTVYYTEEQDYFGGRGSGGRPGREGDGGRPDGSFGGGKSGNRPSGMPGNRG